MGVAMKRHNLKSIIDYLARRQGISRLEVDISRRLDNGNLSFDAYSCERINLDIRERDE